MRSYSYAISWKFVSFFTLIQKSKTFWHNYTDYRANTAVKTYRISGLYPTSEVSRVEQIIDCHRQSTASELANITLATTTDTWYHRHSVDFSSLFLVLLFVLCVCMFKLQYIFKLFVYHRRPALMAKLALWQGCKFSGNLVLGGNFRTFP